MAKPIFIQGLDCVKAIAKYHGADIKLKATSFGELERLYVSGELEHRVQYDLCDQLAGDILDLERQDAVLIDWNNVEHDAVLVIVTSTQEKKYALLVAPSDDEVARAKELLFDGEWLKQGVERTASERMQYVRDQLARSARISII